MACDLQKKPAGSHSVDVPLQISLPLPLPLSLEIVFPRASPAFDNLFMGCVL